MSLPTPESIGKLQQALHEKAKESPSFRFYSLYDKIYREDMLLQAYRIQKRNGGVPGVDGETFDDIEEYGRQKWLSELAEELRSKTYEPEPVKRVWIEKDSGGQRPLGIPTVRDRVAQTATLLVLEPIFEADLHPQQHGYRKDHSAKQAVREVHRYVSRGYNEVVDADLSGYFDSIPHRELMKSISRRVSDGAVLALIEKWLEMPVEETDDDGNPRLKTKARDERVGTPQGAPISPLLANVYMRRFMVAWELLGWAGKLQAKVVNYADDFVICCRGTAEGAMKVMRNIMRGLKLTVNEQKTSLCQLPEESFTFLGYRIGRCYSRRTGRAFIGTSPMKEKVQGLIREISTATSSALTHLKVGDIVGKLNPKLKGWANYFDQGAVSRAYRAVEQHLCRRIRQWLARKHKVRRDEARRRWSKQDIHGRLHLIDITRHRRAFRGRNS